MTELKGEEVNKEFEIRVKRKNEGSEDVERDEKVPRCGVRENDWKKWSERARQTD